MVCHYEEHFCDFFFKFRPVDEMQLSVFFYFLLWRSFVQWSYLCNLVEGIMGNIDGQWLRRSYLKKKVNGRMHARQTSITIAIKMKLK